MPVPGKMDITIKINELPTEVITDKHGWKKFTIDCAGRPVQIALRPRMWTKIEEASRNWPLWLAAITGQMGQSEGKGFHLTEPAVQVFERKARPVEPPPEGVPPVPPEPPPT
jgi:hypothetical protein